MKVAIVMGSKNDLDKVRPAAQTLKEFGVAFEMRVMSAHRTPGQAVEYAKTARENGFGVIICAAGMAAHLAGVFAAHTTLPVIGLPLKGGAVDGLDALLSTVQMPPGVPVATVGLNGAKNAALLAVQILSLESSLLAARLEEYKKSMADAVMAADGQIKLDVD